MLSKSCKSFVCLACIQIQIVKRNLTMELFRNVTLYIFGLDNCHSECHNNIYLIHSCEIKA
jgi:hypothetical protein